MKCLHIYIHTCVHICKAYRRSTVPPARRANCNNNNWRHQVARLSDDDGGRVIRGDGDEVAYGLAK